MQRLGHVERGITRPDNTRSRLRRHEANRLARHAQADGEFRTHRHEFEILAQRSINIGIALVTAVKADLLTQQAAADADSNLFPLLRGRFDVAHESVDGREVAKCILLDRGPRPQAGSVTKFLSHRTLLFCGKSRNTTRGNARLRPGGWRVKTTSPGVSRAREHDERADTKPARH